MSDNISIKGARVNNLQNISLEIPRGKFTVITGVSGSGKSCLAFDTLFAEGQRRFAQSLSSYARQFLGRMSKPDVGSIEGIPPAVAIEQKVNTKNPRSTVATTTELYEYLRLIYSRIGRTFSPVSGGEVHADTVADVAAWLAAEQDVLPVMLLAELGWPSRSDRTELMLSLKEQGFSRLYITDSAESGLAEGPARIDDVLQCQNEPAGAMLLVDRFSSLDDRARLLSSLESAFSAGEGCIALIYGPRRLRKDFSSRFELDGMRFLKPDEFLFSFNSPLGACPVCGGLGKTEGISEDLVIPDKTRSLYDGAIACWRGEKMGWFKDHLCRVAPRYGIPIFEPYCNLPQNIKDLIWEGDRPKEGEDENRLIGINEFFEWVATQRYKIQFKYMLGRFSGRAVCPSCHGSRLRKEALYVKVCGRTIAEVLNMGVEEALGWFSSLELSEAERQIVREPLSEIISRLKYICDVGLGYLTLNRACNTLSGGETQRINLVSALGSSLVGSMYILDEPSIGLHPRDTERLIGVLRSLRDLGNTVVVVEHDEEIIRAADVLLDMGPFAGENGGQVVFNGTIGTGELPKPVLDRSLTLQYITGARNRYTREKRTAQYAIKVCGAMEHNLKNIDVAFPLGVLTVVSGVSGSGKSSLVGDILYPAMYRRLHDSGDLPGAFKGLEGNLDRIARVEYVDQNPIGRSSRSNPVTYLKIYDAIRSLLASQQYAKINGFGPLFFSFNQEGGRCPECQGEGTVSIEMQFMSDVTIVCEECHGMRFKPEILEVRYRGKNVYDILEMSVAQAMAFFAEGPEPEAKQIAESLRPLADVGLEYVKLGQSSSTLSGGESQRIKLAYFLATGTGQVAAREKIMFIFDEPTTGLHFHDVEKLLRAFDALLAKGHTIVVVEHNPDVIRNADWVIDLGPDGGDRGGQVVYEGRPEDMSGTFTSQYVFGK
ncbi:MAG: excinuclease ABC subunit UvrA [Bacteroidales bacterium]|nr:excinuclease ABC subunit UvrA [Candidatus Cryptobacteroides aphodequi]